MILCKGTAISRARRFSTLSSIAISVVPRGYTDDPKLGNWVATQRKEYKLLQDGKQSNMTADRIALLEELGASIQLMVCIVDCRLSDFDVLRFHVCSQPHINTDFAWNAQEAAWCGHMSDLKKFKAKMGHCRVTPNHDEYRKSVRTELNETPLLFFFLSCFS